MSSKIMLNRRHRKGANAIEFALTLPVFVMLVFTTIEYGYYFFISSLVEDANRVGCRDGSFVAEEDATGPVVAAQTSINEHLLSSLQLDCEASHPDNCVIETGIVRFDAAASDTPEHLTLEDKYLSCTVATDFLPAFGIISVMPQRIHSEIIYRLEYQS